MDVTALVPCISAPIHLGMYVRCNKGKSIARRACDKDSFLLFAIKVIRIERGQVECDRVSCATVYVY